MAQPNRRVKITSNGLVIPMVKSIHIENDNCHLEVFRHEKTEKGAYKMVFDESVSPKVPIVDRFEGPITISDESTGATIFMSR